MVKCNVHLTMIWVQWLNPSKSTLFLSNNIQADLNFLEAGCVTALYLSLLMIFTLNMFRLAIKYPFFLVFRVFFLAHSLSALTTWTWSDLCKCCCLDCQLPCATSTYNIKCDILSVVSVLIVTQLKGVKWGGFLSKISVADYCLVLVAHHLRIFEYMQLRT